MCVSWRSIKSSTFHIFLHLTYPFRKKNLLPKCLKVTQKNTQKSQTVVNERETTSNCWMITVLFSCPRYGSHGLGDATLSHLLRPRIDPAYNPAYEDYDYVHDNSFFTNTSTRNRGYFIIAPDWVSERKGIMSTHYQ